MTSGGTPAQILSIVQNGGIEPLVEALEANNPQNTVLVALEGLENIFVAYNAQDNGGIDVAHLNDANNDENDNEFVNHPNLFCRQFVLLNGLAKLEALVGAQNGNDAVTEKSRQIMNRYFGSNNENNINNDINRNVRNANDNGNNNNNNNNNMGFLINFMPFINQIGLGENNVDGNENENNDRIENIEQVRREINAIEAQANELGHLAAMLNNMQQHDFENEISQREQAIDRLEAAMFESNDNNNGNDDNNENDEVNGNENENVENVNNHNVGVEIGIDEMDDLFRAIDSDMDAHDANIAALINANDGEIERLMDDIDNDRNNQDPLADIIVLDQNATDYDDDDDIDTDDQIDNGLF